MNKKLCVFRRKEGKKKSSRTTQQKEGWFIWVSPFLITHHFIAPLLCDADLEQERDNNSNKELLCQYLKCAKMGRKGLETLQQSKIPETRGIQYTLLFQLYKDTEMIQEGHISLFLSV